MHRKGFTLIELLIVVAIIAILAAIAVPNFLEAQMRSKISRVYADMRSLATAFEAYRLDNDDYPLLLKPEPVTTPIPYIATLPIDAFATDDRRQVTRLTFEYVKRNPLEGRNQSYWRDYFCFNWPWRNPFNGGWGQPIPPEWSLPECEWEFKSWGPDRNSWDCPANNGHGDDFSLAYDPTNGTVSHGDLCRFGP